MNPTTITPRAEACPCGGGAVHPHIMRVQRGTQVVTEAHYICPRCSNRFKVGTVSIEDREKKKN